VAAPAPPRAPPPPPFRSNTRLLLYVRAARRDVHGLPGIGGVNNVLYRPRGRAGPSPLLLCSDGSAFGGGWLVVGGRPAARFVIDDVQQRLSSCREDLSWSRRLSAGLEKRESSARVIHFPGDRAEKKESEMTKRE
jgi:hypothetical protein